MPGPTRTKKGTFIHFPVKKVLPTETVQLQGITQKKRFIRATELKEAKKHAREALERHL